MMSSNAPVYVPWCDRPGHDYMHCWAHISCIARANAEVYQRRGGER